MEGEPIVRRDVELNHEQFALVVRTRHRDAVATTAVHRQSFARTIGGARCVPARDGADASDGLTEVGHLSSTMTEKCMAAMIPADGQKSVVVTTREVMDSPERKVEILAEHIRTVAAEWEGAIFGPDMEVGEGIQDALSAHDGLLDHVTGLSTGRRGLSIDANGYTAIGVVEAIRTFFGGASLEGRTVTVQGFGAVGAHTARLLHGLGARIRAVSNKLGMLEAVDGDGLDAAALFELWRRYEDDCLGLWHEQSRSTTRLDANADALFGVAADVFVPAARTSVLAMRDELDAIRATENHRVRDIAEYLDRTGVRLIAEGANHPLSEEAQRFAHARGVGVLPDFIINCGGLIGCWEEWEARHDGFVSDLEEIGERAMERVRNTVRDNVAELLRAALPVREAGEHIVARNEALLWERAGVPVAPSRITGGEPTGAPAQ